MGSKLHALFDESEIRAAIEGAAKSGITIRPVVGHKRASKGIRPDRQIASASNHAAPIIEVLRSGTTRISGTDPDALEKLEGKLASMLAMQENMHRTNDFLKNKDRAGLIRYGYSAEGVEELFLCGPGQQVGYSDQELNNMALNVSRVQDRIIELKRNLVRTTKVIQEHGYQYAEDADQKRVMFMFPEKPITSVRQLLGQSGFRWSPRRSGWVRPLNSNTIQAADAVRAQLGVIRELFVEESKITLH